MKESENERERKMEEEKKKSKKADEKIDVTVGEETFVCMARNSAIIRIIVRHRLIGPGNTSVCCNRECVYPFVCKNAACLLRTRKYVRENLRGL